MSVIGRFSGEYYFLSNFYNSTIVIDSISYPTVEHAFQAGKVHSKSIKELIANAYSPAQAKFMGKCVVLRKDWEDVKEDIMLEALRKKFSNKNLRNKLLDTGTATLVEGNTWGDTYWGVCNGKGFNRLGILLMLVRAEGQKG